ncbi:type II secretion system protein E (GspE) [Rhizobiales bacterium GAS191]|nr:type II secretion system protein E (GspE) [Rhizobiales bacterium GAS191]
MVQLQAAGGLVGNTRVEDRVEHVISILCERGMLDSQALERSRHAARESGERIDIVLRKLGLVSDDNVTIAWSEVTGYPIADSRDFPESAILTDRLSREFLLHAHVLPVGLDGNSLTIALADPSDMFSPAAIAAKTGHAIRVVLARPGELRAALARIYGSEGVNGASGTAEVTQGLALTDDVERLRDLASDAPVIRLVNDIIDRAVESGASDIHLTANEVGTRVRVRIDGVLHDLERPPPSLHAAIISRLKIMASLDIAERRLPQDGRIKMSWRGREVDLRVASMPHLHGEGVVLRILDRSSAKLGLEHLGFSGTLIDAIRRTTAEPHGMFLVSGPTGSGKTTTLYAALSEVATSERNVVTVEDPVEYQLPGVNQVQINRRAGLDFARALRAVLRQDPDIIMVGEIRDRETAAIANQAALTGHLVLATVHTNTAAAALPRLVDMGVEPYLLASTIRAAMAQRLVRRLCAHCRREIALDRQTVDRLVARAGTAAAKNGRVSPRAYKAVGCSECGGTGYRGRIAIGDLMPMTDDVRSLLLRGGDESAIEHASLQDGRASVIEDGLGKVAAGITSLDDMLRAIGTA